jgi:hypothetical protein
LGCLRLASHVIQRRCFFFAVSNLFVHCSRHLVILATRSHCVASSGKTIQGIASMSMYHDEWPLLVLTPSSARYHWEAEFQQWLGKASAKKSAQARVDQVQGETEEEDSEENIPLEEHKNPMNVLNDWEIHVLTSGKEDVFPHRHTKVVVCSYGLAPTLVENGKIQPGMFKCAIVDER